MAIIANRCGPFNAAELIATERHSDANTDVPRAYSHCQQHITAYRKFAFLYCLREILLCKLASLLKPWALSCKSARPQQFRFRTRNRIPIQDNPGERNMPAISNAISTFDQKARQCSPKAKRLAHFCIIIFTCVHSQPSSSTAPVLSGNWSRYLPGMHTGTGTGRYLPGTRGRSRKIKS